MQRPILLTLALLLSTPAFAGHRFEWRPKNAPIEEEIQKEPTMTDFVASLSSYSRKRYGKFSPAQKKTAYLYFERKEFSPDAAVDQVASEEWLRR